MVDSKIGGVLFSCRSLVVGSIFAIICCTVISISGSPYETLHNLNANGILPPVWIFKLFLTLWAFLLGAASGAVSLAVSKKREGIRGELAACKGGIFLVSSFALSLAFYPLFFACERLVLAFLVSLEAAMMSVFCGVVWRKSFGFSALILWGNAFWQVYVAFVSINVLIVN